LRGVLTNFIRHCVRPNISTRPASNQRGKCG
jgi:hypothetical protein